MEPVVRIQGAAAQLGVSESTLKRHERLGLLPAPVFRYVPIAPNRRSCVVYPRRLEEWRDLCARGKRRMCPSPMRCVSWPASLTLPSNAGVSWRRNFGPGSNLAPTDLGTGNYILGTHGCVNLPFDAAQFVWDWAPVGTTVVVI